MRPVLTVLAIVIGLCAAPDGKAMVVAHDIGAPTLNAQPDHRGLRLTGADPELGVRGNMPPHGPAHETVLRPNPLSGMMMVPNTIAGIDTKTGKAQFGYVDGSFLIEDRGNNMNTNDRFPGVPAGTIKRVDGVGLEWVSLNNPVQFGLNDRLRFGTAIDVQRLFYPNPVPRKDVNAYVNRVVRRPALGARLSHIAVELAFNGAVTAAVRPVQSHRHPRRHERSHQSACAIPAGKILQFLFPETNDRFFIAQVLVPGSNGWHGLRLRVTGGSAGARQRRSVRDRDRRVLADGEIRVQAQAQAPGWGDCSAEQRAAHDRRDRRPFANGPQWGLDTRR